MRKSHRVDFQGHFGLQGSSAVTFNSGGNYSMREFNSRERRLGFRGQI